MCCVLPWRFPDSSKRRVSTLPNSHFRFTSEEAFHCSLTFDINYCQNDEKSSKKIVFLFPRDAKRKPKATRRRPQNRFHRHRSNLNEFHGCEATKSFPIASQTGNCQRQKQLTSQFHSHTSSTALSIRSQLNELFFSFTAHFVQLALLTRTVSRHVLFKLKGPKAEASVIKAITKVHSSSGLNSLA